MDRGAWQATVHGAAKSQTQLSDWAAATRDSGRPMLAWVGQKKRLCPLTCGRSLHTCTVQLLTPSYPCRSAQKHTLDFDFLFQFFQRLFPFLFLLFPPLIVNLFILLRTLIPKGRQIPFATQEENRGLWFHVVTKSVPKIKAKSRYLLRLS